MARDTVRGGGRSADSDPTHTNSHSVNRRSYLKYAGVALATTAGLASAGTAGASTDEFDVITIAPGERRYIHIGSNETFENKLIDITAADCACTLIARGTNWTIRNVGWMGRARDHTFIGCSDSGGGTSTIENVYMGDGAEPGHRNGLGIFLHGDHTGHLDINRTNIQEMGDNSFYLSTATEGTVHLRNCYSKNSWVAHYRLARGVVEGCVAVNDDNGMAERDGRGVWGWAPGPIEVRDSQFAMNGRHYSFVSSGNGGGNIYVSNTEWDDSYHGGYREPSSREVIFEDGNGNDPVDVVPAGCPTTPEAAAGGESDGEETITSPEPTPEPAGKLLHIEGTADYRFEVDGAVHPWPDFEQYVTEGDAYGEDWADWFVTEETFWYVEGEFETFELAALDGIDPDVSLTLDGVPVTIADLLDEEVSDPSGKLLHIDGIATYHFDVDGAIRPWPEFEQYMTEGEAYGDDWADWFVTRETFWYVDGEFDTFELGPYDGSEPDVTLRLDDEPVTVEELLGESDDDERPGDLLEIQGVASYRIDVDGEIYPWPEFEQWLEEGVSHGDDWADWFVTQETYWYIDGSVESIEFEPYDSLGPDVSLFLNGEPVTVAELTDEPESPTRSNEQLLHIDGLASYSFEVDGTVQPWPEFEQWLTEGEAYGENWADWFVTQETFWYIDGTFTSFDLGPVDGDGPAVSLSLDGESVTVEQLVNQDGD